MVAVKTEKPTVQKLSDVTIMEQEDAVFETQVTGKPEPTVEWFSGTTKLEPSEKVIYEQEATKHKVTLKTCEVKHTGPISVKVTNEAGSATTKAKLTVKGRHRMCHTNPIPNPTCVTHNCLEPIMLLYSDPYGNNCTIGNIFVIGLIHMSFCLCSKSKYLLKYSRTKLLITFAGQLLLSH